MLTGKAREELKRILKISNWKDLKIIELKVVPGKSRSKTHREMIEAILSCATQPSQILRQQRLRKSVLRRYLWGNFIPVTQEQSKADYIRICLEMWQVKDDDYLWKFRADAEIDAELDRFDENMKESLRELKHRFRKERPSPRELGAMKRSLDKMLSTIRSVGTASPKPSPSAQVTKPSPSRSSSSDRDSDSSSSSASSPSSANIIEQSAKSLASAYLAQYFASQFPPSMNVSEPSASQSPSSMNSFDPSSPQLQSPMYFPDTPSPHVNLSKPSSSRMDIPSSSQVNTSEPSSSQVNTSKPSSSRSATSVQPASRLSSKTLPSAGSENVTQSRAPRDAREFIQTLLPNFFKPPDSVDASDPTRR